MTYRRRLSPTDNFEFKDLTNEEMIAITNQEFPIVLKFLTKVINRVSKRCPNIEKMNIILIVKYMFESIREFLMENNVVELKDIAPIMKLSFYKWNKDNKTLDCVKVKCSTPNKLKNYE